MIVLRHTLVLVALGSLPASIVAHPALAADVDPSVAKARSAFERGAALAAEARWSDALGEFERSASLRPHATTSYNIGYCERALGRPTRAKKAFASALALDQASGGSELSASLREATTRYLDEMRALVATPTLTIDPVGAVVTVDGRPLEAADGHYLAGTRPAGPGEPVASRTFVLEIDAGAHEIVVIAPDGRSKVAHEYFPPGSTKAVRVVVDPAKVTTRTVVAESSSPARRTIGFTLGGLGIAALAFGGYFGLRARSTWRDARDACSEASGAWTCADDRGATLSARARDQANVATIAAVAGGAAILGGTILVITSGPSSDRARVSWSTTPGGAAFQLEGTF
jgi:hypothetical protein